LTVENNLKFTDVANFGGFLPLKSLKMKVSEYVCA
jgi:hypothetical protein